MTHYAIIVAGGTGSRFGSAIPKQFLPLAGLPVLMHSITRFIDAQARVIVVLPREQVNLWHDLCQQYTFSLPVSIVTGGDSRFQSVKNALSTIDATPGDVIAVHDGVRPLVTAEIIKNAYTEAAIHGSAIPVVPVTDSIREIDGDHSAAIDRSRLVAVQTPQAFNAAMLKNAYNVAFDPSFTDDASVVERAGHSIHLINGDTCNIKITHPGDIEIAEILLKRGKPC